MASGIEEHFRVSSDNLANVAHFPGLASAATARPIVPALTFTHVLIALLALTAIRIVGLHFSVVDLFFDEAQYWTWSRELAFG